MDPEMTKEEIAILGALKRGRENVMGVKALIEQIGMDLENKEARRIIRHLVMEHEILIASTVGRPPGFFIAETAEEAKKAVRSLRHRGISILARAAKLERLSREENFGQGRMEFETGRTDKTDKTN